MAYPDIDTSVVQWQVRTHFDVLNELLGGVASGRAAVIAIDGHSGSGKTTLANGLAALEPHVPSSTRTILLRSTPSTGASYSSSIY